MFRKLHELSPDHVTVFLDGVPVTAESDETIAAVIVRQPEPWSRLTPATHGKRAPYCMMGVCFECVAEVDGIASVQTCLMRVADGMRILRPVGKRKI